MQILIEPNVGTVTTSAQRFYIAASKKIYDLIHHVHFVPGGFHDVGTWNQVLLANVHSLV